MVEHPPSPKDHAHDVGVFVEASVKVTVRGVVPLRGVPVNAAVGAAGAGAESVM